MECGGRARAHAAAAAATCAGLAWYAPAWAARGRTGWCGGSRLATGQSTAAKFGAVTPSATAVVRPASTPGQRASPRRPIARTSGGLHQHAIHAASFASAPAENAAASCTATDNGEANAACHAACYATAYAAPHHAANAHRTTSPERATAHCGPASAASAERATAECTTASTVKCTAAAAAPRDAAASRDAAPSRAAATTAAAP